MPFTPAKQVRVLVADDSAVCRERLCEYIQAEPGLEVAGIACDGDEAVDQALALQPDVITLDVLMPKRSGLEALTEILAQRPVPVIMVSAVTQRTATVTLDALDKGALDYLAKPEGGASESATWRAEYVHKIKIIAGSDVRRVLRIRREKKERKLLAEQESSGVTRPADSGRVPARSMLGGATALPSKVTLAPDGYAEACIAIGISTGGPPALARLFAELQPPLPPLIVVQHMPPQFTAPFAWRLNSLSALEVKEAATGDVLRPNLVLLAPGGNHLSLRRSGARIACVVRSGDPVSGHMPSVDVLMESAAPLFGQRCLGVIMTGMGRDGSAGCQAIRARGGYVLGQDEASSDVYGMNKVAWVAGHVDRQFSLEEAARIIQRKARELASA